MKKLSYLLGIILVASIIFTSCSDDDDAEPTNVKPTITFQTGGDYTSSDVTIDATDTIYIKVIATANSNSGAKLTAVRIYTIFNNAEQDIANEDINESSFEAEWAVYGFTGDTEGILYAKVTDKDGETNTVSFKITVNEATTPLGNAEDLEWQRVAGNAATGLDMFGLKWTSNGKEVFAEITKDGADKFVMLESADWENLATMEDLMAAIESGTDMEEYKGISAEVPQDYDEVLGVQYDGGYYLIHLTHGDIDVDPVQGTTITIDGQYKM